MNTTQTITLVLTSSLLAACLTALVNWFLHKNNYRNEYYKKILDKRLNAYEQVQRLLSLLTGSVQLDNGDICVFQLALGKEHFGKFLTVIFGAIEKSFWLSEETSELLKDLNLFFLHTIDNAIDENHNYDLQLQELGVEHRQKIKEMQFALQNQVYLDLSSLHEIKKFIKPKTIGSVRKIHSKPHPLQKKKENDTTKHQV